MTRFLTLSVLSLAIRSLDMWERLFERVAVIEVHLWERRVNLDEYLAELFMIHKLRDYGQDGAQLLILLLEA